MSTLVSIGQTRTVVDFSAHRIEHLPVLVVFPHNQCNCRCMMCDIWRIREAKQVTPEQVDHQLTDIRKLGVSWVVFSGGEPQLNEKWAELARMFRNAGTRVTLLTAGLLLKPQAAIVAESVDDVIVSIDGPPPLHNSIRRVARAFEQMAEGVSALREIRPSISVRGRCTVQRANHHSLRAVAAYAHEIGLNSVSFLAADLTSSAFNRESGWTSNQCDRVALGPSEVQQLEYEVEHLIEDSRTRFEPGFIVESSQKLRRIVRHFRAYLGQTDALSPRCNAPWVSAVIEASGEVRPCFFHPAFGNIQEGALSTILNGPRALEFRASLDVERNETCRRCVCSLHIPREAPDSRPPAP